MRFFDSLVGKVKMRIDQRKRNKEALLTERNSLLPLLSAANTPAHAKAELRMTALMTELQAAVESLELKNYLADFEAVLLHPEEYLHMNQTSLILDSMGIKRTANDGEHGRALVFSELIGYDRRDWTMTIVRCVNLEYESFAKRLDKAYRSLTLY
jgi:hypothetical protein